MQVYGTIHSNSQLTQPKDMGREFVCRVLYMWNQLCNLFILLLSAVLKWPCKHGLICELDMC